MLSFYFLYDHDHQVVPMHAQTLNDLILQGFYQKINVMLISVQSAILQLIVDLYLELQHLEQRLRTSGCYSGVLHCFITHCSPLCSFQQLVLGLYVWGWEPDVRLFLCFLMKSFKLVFYHLEVEKGILRTLARFYDFVG